MSIYYYELKKPITHIAIEDTMGYCKISIFVNHGFSGLLTVRKEELNDTLELFTDEKVIFHSHYGGSQKGEILKKINETNNLIVISEYGRIVEVEKLEEMISNARY